MDSVAFHISLIPSKPWSDIAIAWLADEGCNAFEENETGLIAYANQKEINSSELIEKLQQWAEENALELEIHAERIEQQNWNELWEADFKPVVVEDFVTIVAPFHDKMKTEGMIVEIQPQMSFGTGHHQTTWMMTKAIFEYGTLPASVLDMGTGTGILAILAEKLGAKEILAIDIEEWSAENTRENALRNDCKKIDTKHGDIDLIKNRKFGLILANINMNVLKTQFEEYAESLQKNGRILISGFFETDVREMLEFVSQFDLELEKKWNKETWAALQLKRKNDE